MTLDTKPKFFNLNKRTQGSFRNCAYNFNTLPHRLTDIEDPKRYKKWLKIFIRNPTKLPNPLPTPEVEKANNLSEKLRKQMYPRIKTKLVRPPPDIPPTVADCNQVSQITWTSVSLSNHKMNYFWRSQSSLNSLSKNTHFTLQHIYMTSYMKNYSILSLTYIYSAGQPSPNQLHFLSHSNDLFHPESGS